MLFMQTVLLTPTFLRQVNAVGLDEDELQEIVTVIATEPLSGDLVAGAGGARKLRHAAHGKGKSGGYRTIHYFGGEDIPVFLLAIYGKSQKSALSTAEKNELAKLLPVIGRAYRKTTRS
ncbi:MAG: type II toxin-antitoxin system RelE/ParE family toxin [Aestuariivirga sp.]